MTDISAEELYKKSNLGEVNKQINEIYNAICTKIREEHQTGRAETIYELPDTFIIGNLEPADSQLIIYSRLIERFANRGLDVKLLREGDESALRIRWPSALDPVERQRMKSIIIKHMGVWSEKKK